MHRVVIHGYSHSLIRVLIVGAAANKSATGHIIFNDVAQALEAMTLANHFPVCRTVDVLSCYGANFMLRIFAGGCAIATVLG
jgi:hypothetical protein